MGLTIYRAAVSAEEAKKALGYLPQFMLADSQGRVIISYFQSLDSTTRLIHISLHLPTGEGHGDEVQSWHKDANRDEILDAFADLDNTILKLVK